MNQYIMTSLCKVWIHLPLSSLKKSPPICFSAKKNKLLFFRWKDLQISGDVGFKSFFTASLPKSWTSFEPHKGLAVREDMLSNDQEKTKTDGWKNLQQSPFRYNMLDNHLSKTIAFSWVSLGVLWTLKVRLPNIQILIPLNDFFL